MNEAKKWAPAQVTAQHIAPKRKTRRLAALLQTRLQQLLPRAGETVGRKARRSPICSRQINRIKQQQRERSSSHHSMGHVWHVYI